MLDWLALLLLVRLKWREHRRPYVPLDPTKECLHGYVHISLYDCPCCKMVITRSFRGLDEFEVALILENAAHHARLQGMRRKHAAQKPSLRIVRPSEE